MMLNNTENPVAWPILVYELEDAKDHLVRLIDEMAREGAIDPEGFAVDLGHIFAHLNRAWNGRNDPNYHEWTQDEREHRSQFPSDLTPVG
jgi:hypothetical protein